VTTNCLIAIIFNWEDCIYRRDNIPNNMKLQHHRRCQIMINTDSKTTNFGTGKNHSFMDNDQTKILQLQSFTVIIKQRFFCLHNSIQNLLLLFIMNQLPLTSDFSDAPSEETQLCEILSACSSAADTSDLGESKAVSSCE
jgi:hypothetical protein